MLTVSVNGYVFSVSDGNNALIKDKENILCFKSASDSNIVEIWETSVDEGHRNLILSSHYSNFATPSGTTSTIVVSAIIALLNTKYIPDYKQGSYTPVVTLTGAGTSPQYLTATGTYTKIGRTVFFQIFLSGDGGNEGSGAGQITVSLPPYATSTLQNAIVDPCGNAVNGVQEYLIYIQYSASSLTAELKYSSSSSQTVAFTGADQNNTTRSITLQSKYITDL